MCPTDYFSPASFPDLKPILIFMIRAVLRLKYRISSGFPSGSAVKNPPADAGDVSLISWFRRFPGGRSGNSSILAWKILWTEETGGLQSVGLQRVRHDWVCTHISSKILSHWHLGETLDSEWLRWSFHIHFCVTTWTRELVRLGMTGELYFCSISF